MFETSLSNGRDKDVTTRADELPSPGDTGCGAQISLWSQHHVSSLDLVKGVPIPDANFNFAKFAHKNAKHSLRLNNRIFWGGIDFSGGQGVGPSETPPQLDTPQCQTEC